MDKFNELYNRFLENQRKGLIPPAKVREIEERLNNYARAKGLTAPFPSASATLLGSVSENGNLIRRWYKLRNNKTIYDKYWRQIKHAAKLLKFGGYTVAELEDALRETPDDKTLAWQIGFENLLDYYHFKYPQKIINEGIKHSIHSSVTWSARDTVEHGKKSYEEVAERWPDDAKIKYMARIGRKYWKEDIQKKAMQEQPKEIEPEKVTEAPKASELGKENNVPGAVEKVKPQIIFGESISVKTAGENIPARYGLFEIGALIPSHNPFSFSKNPEYPAHCQERSYDSNKQLQFNVTNNAKHFEPVQLLTEDMTASSGPPVVNAGGVVLGGNGRAMILQLVEKNNPQLWGEYKRKLQQRLSFYGFTEEQYYSLSQPVLVRVVEVDMNKCMHYSWLLNADLTNAQPEEDRAAALSKEFDDETLYSLGVVLTESEIDTPAEMFASKKVTDELVRILRNKGIINNFNNNQWIESGQLTKHAKDNITSVLLQVAVNDKKLIGGAKNYEAKILKTIPYFIAIRGMQGKWNIIHYFTAAIKHEAERRARGISKAEYLPLSKNKMFEAAPPESEFTAWDALDLPIGKFKTFLQKFIESARSNMDPGASMFALEPAEPEDVMKTLLARTQSLAGINDNEKQGIIDYAKSLFNFPIDVHIGEIVLRVIANGKVIVDIDTLLMRYDSRQLDLFSGKSETEDYTAQAEKILSFIKVNHKRAKPPRQDALFGLSDEINTGNYDTERVPVPVNIKDIMRMPVPTGLKLNRTKTFFGKLLPHFTMLIWGRPGGGKSTFALKFAEDLALNGKVLYFLTEEKLSAGRVGERLTRNRIKADNVDFDDSGDFFVLRDIVERNLYDYIIIDSINKVNGINTEQIDDFIDEAIKMFPNLSIISIAQTDKSRRNYKGPADFAHNVDTEIVVEGGTAETIKHRDGTLQKYPVFSTKGARYLNAFNNFS